jgi:putative membrane protein
MRSTITVLGLTLLAACSSGDADADGSDTTQAALPAPAPAAPTAAAPAVTDPQIADIVVAANEVDIAAGEIARTKGTDPRVKAFGERMVTDHTGVNQAAGELVGRLGVTPEASATSGQLRRDGELAREALQRETGAAFDRAYIDGEVTYHEAVLKAIDDTLIPGAQNAELKALLEQTRPAVAAHLQHARELQTALGAQ